MPTRLVTRICSHCGRHFDVDPRETPEGYPGWCPKHNQLRREAEWNCYRTSIRNLEPGEYLILPITAHDPQPWKTYAPVVEEFNQDHPPWEMEIHEIRKGDCNLVCGVVESDAALVWLFDFHFIIENNRGEVLTLGQTMR